MRCLVVDDEEYDREVVTRVVRRAGHEVISAGAALDAVKLVQDPPCAVALVDLGMPEVDGVSALRLLRGAAPELPLLVVSGFDDRAHVLAAVGAGADGYVVKTDLAALPQAITDVIEGGGPMSSRVAHYLLEELRVDDSPKGLSARQQQILELLKSGRTYNEIAAQLNISANTVRHHIRVITRKLDGAGGMAAIRLAFGGPPDD